MRRIGAVALLLRTAFNHKSQESSVFPLWECVWRDEADQMGHQLVRYMIMDMDIDKLKNIPFAKWAEIALGVSMKGKVTDIPFHLPFRLSEYIDALSNPPGSLESPSYYKKFKMANLTNLENGSYHFDDTKTLKLGWANMEDVKDDDDLRKVMYKIMMKLKKDNVPLNNAKGGYLLPIISGTSAAITVKTENMKIPVIGVSIPLTGTEYGKDAPVFQLKYRGTLRTSGKSHWSNVLAFVDNTTFIEDMISPLIISSIGTLIFRRGLPLNVFLVLSWGIINEKISNNMIGDTTGKIKNSPIIKMQTMDHKMFMDNISDNEKAVLYHQIHLFDMITKPRSMIKMTLAEREEIKKRPSPLRIKIYDKFDINNIRYKTGKLNQYKNHDIFIEWGNYEIARYNVDPLLVTWSITEPPLNVQSLVPHPIVHYTDYAPPWMNEIPYTNRTVPPEYPVPFIMEKDDSPLLPIDLWIESTLYPVPDEANTVKEIKSTVHNGKLRLSIPNATYNEVDEIQIYDENNKLIYHLPTHIIRSIFSTRHTMPTINVWFDTKRDDVKEWDDKNNNDDDDEFHDPAGDDDDDDDDDKFHDVPDYNRNEQEPHIHSLIVTTRNLQHRMDYHLYQNMLYDHEHDKWADNHILHTVLFVYDVRGDVTELLDAEGLNV